MRKIFLLWLIGNLACTPLFSQKKDSLSKIQEMQELNRLGDSLHQAQLARDSAFREMMDESARKLNQSMAASKQKELESATNEVMQRREKEQGTKRKTMLLALSAFLITIIVVRIVSKRKKQKSNPA